MNKVVVLTGSILIGLNIIIGLLLSSYQNFNLMLTTLVLLYAMGAIILCNKVISNKVFVISLTCLFSAIGVIKFIAGLLSPDKIMDNWGVVTIIVLSVLETIIFVAVKYISTTIQNNN